MNSLKKYNTKRNFKVTKEPVGQIKKSSKKLKFCIQHHLAKKDHYDLRLELNGVYLSWAVPKGPSYSPKDKRLAIKVEDHPLSYGNFEGTIPKGEYGAGIVMLWDKGEFIPEVNFKENLKKGIIKFTLKGKRIKGKWSLVRFKEDNWLLLKENDEYKNYANINKYQTSIKTNRTMTEIEKGKTKPKTSRKEAVVCGITITNPDKVIFSNPKITKLDIAMYYHKIAKKMLPYLQNRLISTVRAPEGITKETFFKKHFDTNPYLKKVTIPSKEHKEDYYYIANEEGLIYEVQMNSYEFHIWGSQVSDLNHPDLMVFDLDPDIGLSLKKVREGVKDLQKILKEFNLKASIKVSGGKGYHIMVPIKNKISWAKFSKIAQNIAELLVERYPDKYTTNIKKEARKGKIFIDYLRNKKSATFVAPYSLRLKSKPSISLPISWTDLDNIKPNEILITKYL